MLLPGELRAGLCGRRWVVTARPADAAHADGGGVVVLGLAAHGDHEWAKDLGVSCRSVLFAADEHRRHCAERGQQEGRMHAEDAKCDVERSVTHRSADVENHRGEERCLLLCE